MRISFRKFEKKRHFWAKKRLFSNLVSLRFWFFHTKIEKRIADSCRARKNSVEEVVPIFPNRKPRISIIPLKLKVFIIQFQKKKIFLVFLASWVVLASIYRRRFQFSGRRRYLVVRRQLLVKFILRAASLKGISQFCS